MKFEFRDLESRAVEITKSHSTVASLNLCVPVSVIFQDLPSDLISRLTSLWPRCLHLLLVKISWHFF